MRPRCVVDRDAAGQQIKPSIGARADSAKPPPRSSDQPTLETASNKDDVTVFSNCQVLVQLAKISGTAGRKRRPPSYRPFVESDDDATVDDVLIEAFDGSQRRRPFGIGR